MLNHFGVNSLGYTCATLVNDNKTQRREPEQNFKSHLSPNCSLKLRSMKLESIVIVDHHATVN